MQNISQEELQDPAISERSISLPSITETSDVKRFMRYALFLKFWEVLRSLSMLIYCYFEFSYNNIEHYLFVSHFSEYGVIECFVRSDISNKVIR